MAGTIRVLVNMSPPAICASKCDVPAGEVSILHPPREPTEERLGYDRHPSGRGPFLGAVRTCIRSLHTHSYLYGSCTSCLAILRKYFGPSSPTCVGSAGHH